MKPIPGPITALEELQGVRNKLLDLTNKNRLLNYKYTKYNSIRLVDELPDQIFEKLLNNQQMTFIPIPAPTEKELIEAGFIDSNCKQDKSKSNTKPSAEEWAKFVGINPNHELPNPNSQQKTSHYNKELQVLMYPNELEDVLRKIRSKSQSAIEEAGSNILYLAIGFLEWIESDDSDITYIAPLFTIPIQLTRSSFASKDGTFPYSISIKDEDLITNITLKQKLLRDFDIALPNITEGIKPEEYFLRIKETILVRYPRWKIHRQASVIQLNFSKQVIYEDLNPEAWPEKEKLEQHPILSHFFGSSILKRNDNYIFPEEYLIDTIKNIHDKFPLIYDADSSQHSAIVDTVNGKNLVIIGPPGSGKSQTITNIIAALISNGKSVLFVAEKIAALNVVKNKLSLAGLDDFCLELHSNKTNRQKLMRDLSVRIEKHNHYRKPNETELDIQLYENYKEKLNTYANLINNEWKSTGLRIQEIFSRATRFELEQNFNPILLEIQGYNGDNLTKLEQNILINNTELLRDLFLQISEKCDYKKIIYHNWYGINNINIDYTKRKILIELLNNWNQSLSSLDAYWKLINTKLNFNIKENLPISQITHIIGIIMKLPEINNDYFEVNFPELSKHVLDFEIFVKYYDSTYNCHSDLLNFITIESLSSSKTINYLKNITSTLYSLGVEDNMSLKKIIESKPLIDDAKINIKTIQQYYEKLFSASSNNFINYFPLTISGLNEFSLFISTLNKLPIELLKFRNNIYDNVEIDVIIEKMSNILRTTIPLHNLLYTIFDLNKLPPAGELIRNFEILKTSGFIKWFSSEWRNARYSIRQLAITKNLKTSLLIHHFPNLILYKHNLNKLDKIKDEHSILYDLFDGINTPLDRMIIMRRWYKTVRDEYGYSFETRKQIGDTILTLEDSIIKTFLNCAEHGLSKSIQIVVTNSTQLNLIYKRFLAENESSSTLIDTIENLSHEYDKISILSSIILNYTDYPMFILKEIVEKLSLQQQLINKMKTLPLVNILPSIGLKLSFEPNSFTLEKLISNKNILNILLTISTELWLRNSIQNNWTALSYEGLIQTQKELELILNDVYTAQEKVVSFTQLNIDNWSKSTDGTIVSLIKRNKRAIDNPGGLHIWIEYLKLCLSFTKYGISNIINLLENNEINPLNIVNAIQLVLYRHLSKEILAENEFLYMFSGMEEDAIANKFKEYDNTLMKLQRELTAYKTDQVNLTLGVSSGKVKDYSELSLIQHIIGLKRSNITIRDLLQRSGNTIKTLKPCFMMSPMSVAQYLTPGVLKFDVVIMDEASQIRPEDAIGSIARGKSFLVVGDPKQLPPTSFFEKLIEEDNDNATALEQTNSILDTMTPIFETRLLKWHYRSQHQKLIAFSNQKFYDSKLIIFPSSIKKCDQLGIYYNRINNGSFINRRNIEEAKVVALAAAEQILNYPNDSIGIVAMNLEQSYELEVQFEYIIKNKPIYREAILRNLEMSEPLFIKNLESVQGDERDVIIISMTYGPESMNADSMAQRFGPINSELGWRRLNVLFTRSRKRMLVYSSMDSNFIRISDNSSRGVSSLKEWLIYCETGNLIQSKSSHRDPESDFEIAVISALKENGYECEPQVGQSGYFIDIGVLDPDIPGRYLMGIECDGASYHSAKSARERDRLRQEILERLGWRIRRIWSTDWFRNPKDQIATIVSELAEIRNKNS